MQKNILSLKIKEFRKQKDLTQEDFAELLDVSNKSVSKWELGKGYPSKKNMIKISEVMGVPLEVLMIEEQTQNNRLRKSLEYTFFSYCILFALTLLIQGIREPNLYPDILSREVSEVIKIVTVTFAHNIYIAGIPAIIIGLVFYFYIFPRQDLD